jgi:hypothetical protein
LKNWSGRKALDPKLKGKFLNLDAITAGIFITAIAPDKSCLTITDLHAKQLMGALCMAQKSDIFVN